jgi:hypothetical protein
MASTQMSSPTIDNEIRGEERVLWRGRPQRGLKLRSADWLLIPASLLWGGFAIFWEVMALNIPKQNAVGYIFPLFGIPFVLIGLYLIVGRFFVDAKMREGTEYALTTQRAIIKSGIFSKKIKSLNLKAVPDISMTEVGNGVGTITFGDFSNSLMLVRGFGWPGMNYAAPPSFDLIENVRSVYEQIIKVQKGH